jgi:hypothetical protein
MPTTSKPTRGDTTVADEASPAVVQSTSQDDLATQLATAQQRIAELETTAPLGIAPVAPQESARYYVTAVGACYAVDGAPTNIGLALHGQVVELVDSEAERLLIQGAVRPASVDDIANEALRVNRSAAAVDAEIAGPASNPYGGSLAGTSLERHAREQIAIAKRSGAVSDVAAAKAEAKLDKQTAGSRTRTGVDVPVVTP